MKDNNTYIYKDISKKIPDFTYSHPNTGELVTGKSHGYGVQIGLIFCTDSILAADEAFKRHWPEHCDKKGNIKSTIVTQVIFGNKKTLK